MSKDGYYYRREISTLDDLSNNTHWVKSGNNIYNKNLTGNVGIDLMNPVYNLDVSGDLHVSKRLYDNLNTAGNTGQVLTTTGIGFKWADVSNVGAASYWQASGTDIYNGNLGNVGIGISGPIYKLDVSGETRIQTTNVRIGIDAGYDNQGSYGIAIGYQAGITSQSQDAIAIGNNAGAIVQGNNSIAVGNNAAYFGQAGYSVAIGYQAGYSLQGSSAVAIGYTTAYDNQQEAALALGLDAGRISQGTRAISIGVTAGKEYQGVDAVAIGDGAGTYYQSTNAISMGFYAGHSLQGTNSIAIGRDAGSYDQSQNCIAIGAFAARTQQHANSIVLNATGIDLSTTNTGSLYISPIREQSTTKILNYNTSTKEVTYGDVTILDISSSPGLSGETLISIGGGLGYKWTTPVYGSFTYDLSKSIDLSGGIPIPTVIPYNRAEIANWCDFSGSRIYVRKSGVFKISYSVQLDQQDNQYHPVDIYIRINGVNVPRSSSKWTLENKDSETVAFTEFILPLNNGQYFEIVFYSDGTTVTATAFPGNSDYPSIPSIITNVYSLVTYPSP